MTTEGPTRSPDASAADLPSLGDLRPGAEGVVVGVVAPARRRRRLLEMGFVAGTPVRVVRRAPLGDPMEVALHGYHLSLRRAEARAIQLRGDGGPA